MAIAQVVEHLVVVQDVAGSSPVSHPKSNEVRSPALIESEVAPLLHFVGSELDNINRLVDFCFNLICDDPKSVA